MPPTPRPTPSREIRSSAHSERTCQMNNVNDFILTMATNCVLDVRSDFFNVILQNISISKLTLHSLVKTHKHRVQRVSQDEISGALGFLVVGEVTGSFL